MNSTVYASALYSATQGLNKEDTEKRVKVFIELVKSRGHERLLPSLSSSYEKRLSQKVDKVTLTVASDKDLKRTKEEIRDLSGEFNLQDLDVKVDELLVGGYVLKSQNNLYDKSYRRALKKLYQKIIA